MMLLSSKEHCYTECDMLGNKNPTHPLLQPSLHPHGLVTYFLIDDVDNDGSCGPSWLLNGSATRPLLGALEFCQRDFRRVVDEVPVVF